MTEFVLIVYLFTVVCVFGAIGMIVRKWIHRIRTKISFEQSLKKSELIIIPLYNNGKKLNFVVDSGSTCNIINASVVGELNILQEDIDASKIESISIAGDTRANNVVSMIGCGWDPGTDSVVRALMKIVAIKPALNGRFL